MELVGMTELDLNGILFAFFEDSVPLEECRERLELLVYQIWNEDYDGLDDADRPPLALTPFFVHRAIIRKNVSHYRKMPRERREICLKWCWEERARNLAERKKKLGDKNNG